LADVEIDPSFFEYESVGEDWTPIFEAMAKLKKGWNSYSADPPSELAKTKAQEFIKLCDIREFHPRRVVASAVGGVGVTFGDSPDKEAYVEFLNDGDVVMALVDHQIKDIKVEVVTDYLKTIITAKKYLRWCEGQLSWS